MNANNLQSKNGFSLVEVIVTIVVVAGLSAITFTAFQTFNRQADEAKTRALLQRIALALDEYHRDNHQYPLGENLYRALSGNEPVGDQRIYLLGLKASENPEGLVGGIESDRFLVDPFGNRLLYLRGDEPGVEHPEFILCSVGADGIPMTPDDICL